jgi:hypothetical protein
VDAGLALEIRWFYSFCLSFLGVSLTLVTLFVVGIGSLISKVVTTMG